MEVFENINHDKIQVSPENVVFMMNMYKCKYMFMPSRTFIMKINYFPKSQDRLLIDNFLFLFKFWLPFENKQ